MKPAIKHTSNKARVTVVIACYNAEKTLQATIDSLIAQSLQDWHLIIVNDGSTDGSLVLARKNAQQDARIRVIDQVNQGPSVARNTGVEKAGTDLIAFLDSDDLWLPEHLAKNIALLDENPETGISYGGCYFRGSDGVLTGDKSQLSAYRLEVQDILSSNPTTSCSALVFRKKIYQDAGGLRSDMKFAEDQEWLFRVILSGWAVSSVNDYTFYYQTSEDGLSANLEKMQEGWEHFMRLARKMNPALIEENYDKARSEMAWYHARRSLRTTQPFGITWHYLWRSLKSRPQIFLKKPAHFIAVGLASFAPVLANRTQKMIRFHFGNI